MHDRDSIYSSLDLLFYAPHHRCSIFTFLAARLLISLLFLEPHHSIVNNCAKAQAGADVKGYGLRLAAQGGSCMLKPQRLSADGTHRPAHTQG
jgi:hypothetical protein